MSALDPPKTAPPLGYPGDVYRDRVNGWRRRYTLDGDRLIIQRTKFLGSESRSTILLRNIDPIYEIVRHRNEAPIGGIVAVGGVLAILSLAIYYLGAAQVFRSASSLPLEIMAILYLIVSLRSIRRVEFYTFRYSDGRFDIARRGPDRDRFDAFIARLAARIEAIGATDDRGSTTSSVKVR